MESIVERLKNDIELEMYFGLSDEDSEQYLNEILRYCDTNFEDVKKLCQKTIPSSVSPHYVIFTALSQDWEKWGGFLVDEYIRIYKNAKKDSDPEEYMDSLLSIEIPDSDKSRFKKIIDYIFLDIRNSDDRIVQMAIQQLGYLIDESNYQEHKNYIDQIKSNVNHPNRKIRLTTFEFLKYFPQIPKTEYKLQISDQLRIKMPFLFGTNQITKDEKQKKSTIQWNWLRYLYFAFALYFLIHPEPYKLLYTLLICVPLVEFIFTSIQGTPQLLSIVKINRRKTDIDSDESMSLIDYLNFAFVFILFRIYFDFEIEHYSAIFKPLFLVFSIAIMAVYFTKPFLNAVPGKNLMNLGILLNTFLYSLIFTVGINCVYDSSKTKVFEAKIIGKYQEKHKNTYDYYLELEPWGTSYHIPDMEVSEEKYKHYKVGKILKIDVKEGLLNISWYYIE